MKGYGSGISLSQGNCPPTSHHAKSQPWDKASLVSSPWGQVRNSWAGATSAAFPPWALGRILTCSGPQFTHVRELRNSLRNLWMFPDPKTQWITSESLMENPCSFLREKSLALFAPVSFLNNQGPSHSSGFWVLMANLRHLGRKSSL